jgi:hypothetical protein
MQSLSQELLAKILDGSLAVDIGEARDGAGVVNRVVGSETKCPCAVRHTRMDVAAVLKSASGRNVAEAQRDQDHARVLPLPVARYY